MKSIPRVTGIFMTALAMLALSGTAGFAEVAAQGLLQNSNLFLLTQNHVRTVYYDLDSTVGGQNGLHSTYLLGLNVDSQAIHSILKVRLVYNSPLTKGSEAVYFVAGFFLALNQLTNAPVIAPLFQYLYATGGALSVETAVPKTTYGVIFTGIVYATNIEFPVTLGTIISLTPVYPAT